MITSYFMQVEKRLRFVISSLILTGMLLASTLFYFDWGWFFVPLLIAITYGLTYFSILEGIEKIEWLTLFLMPVFFTVAFYVFYFLFPVRWLTRVPFLILYLISIYALFLTSNIFNVGVEKSLRLYKAAFSVNYLYQTVLVYLVANIIFSFKGYFFTNAILMGLCLLPLCYQLLWSIKLDLQVYNKENIRFALLMSLLMGEFTLIISFIPFQVSIQSLLIAAGYYSLLGLTTAHTDNRLFKNTIREYVFVVIFVGAVAILTLNGW